MKKKAVILALLWVLIGSVWFVGFRWESWIGAGTASSRGAEAEETTGEIYRIEAPTGESDAAVKENPPAVEPAEETPAAEPAFDVYILNTSSKKIHCPTCSSVGEIKPENRAQTADPEAALAEGYVWCKRCHG